MAASMVEPAPEVSATEIGGSAPGDRSTSLPPDWQTRLRARLLEAPDHRLDFEPAEALQAAAALVPIILRPDTPTVLLTVRSRHLRRHAGQISFPGGALDAADANAAAAAVRETEEEVGIARHFIEPIGYLPDHFVGSGFRLTPVVALLQPGFELRPERGEVEEVFELPLAFALSSANYRLRRRTVRTGEQEFWELSYGARNIWGATARVLVSLRERLERPPP
jgi:8-oxo-dGTP pyrophosphatase MutT (NUDIX family)